MIKKYQPTKIHSKIEAIKYTGDNLEECIEFIGKYYYLRLCNDCHKETVLVVRCSDQDYDVGIGSMIAKYRDEKGNIDFRIFHPVTFKELYEEVRKYESREVI